MRKVYEHLLNSSKCLNNINIEKIGVGKMGTGENN